MYGLIVSKAGWLAWRVLYGVGIAVLLAVAAAVADDSQFWLMIFTGGAK